MSLYPPAQNRLLSWRFRRMIRHGYLFPLDSDSAQNETETGDNPCKHNGGLQQRHRRRNQGTFPEWLSMASYSRPLFALAGEPRSKPVRRDSDTAPDSDYRRGRLAMYEFVSFGTAQIEHYSHLFHGQNCFFHFCLLLIVFCLRSFKYCGMIYSMI